MQPEQFSLPLAEAAKEAGLAQATENAGSCAWGAVFHEPGWVLVGRKKSAVASNHAREIRLWQWQLP